MGAFSGGVYHQQKSILGYKNHYKAFDINSSAVLVCKQSDVTKFLSVFLQDKEILAFSDYSPSLERVLPTKQITCSWE